MKDAFRSRSLAAVRAEDLLVAWLLSLLDELDPALAARPILGMLAVHGTAGAARNHLRLIHLLGEITQYPRSRLRADREVRRRRAPSA